MSRWLRFSGILGAVMFLFGLVAALIVGGEFWRNPLIMAHFVLGIGLILAWLFTFGAASLGQAGAVVSGRGARFGANALLYVSIFAGVLIVLNWFAHRYNKRWDLTEEGVYSLSSQSIQAVSNLRKPLKLIAFKTEDPNEEAAAREMLDLYSYHNQAQVKSEVVDPRSSPHLIDLYEMKPGNLLYLEYGEGDKKAVSRINEMSEEAVTNAIIKLTRGDAKKIYMVEGHDEPAISDFNPVGLKELADALSDEHLSVEGLFLADKGAVPEDAAVVILASPKKPLLPAERDMLIQYVEAGGRLLLFSDPRKSNDIAKLADHFGISVGDDVVIDQVQRLFAAPALGAQPIVREYASHAITRQMTARDITVFNISSSVNIKDKDNKAATYTELLKTGPSAWAEKNLAALFDSAEPSAVLEAEDAKGPITLAVAFEKKLEADAGKAKSEEEANFEKIARVVVFGDSDWILNANLGVYSNRDLVLNTVNWLAGEEGGISIRAKSIKESSAPIERSTFLFILASSLILPELILVLGLLVWWKRKTVNMLPA